MKRTIGVGSLGLLLGVFLFCTACTAKESPEESSKSSSQPETSSSSSSQSAPIPEEPEVVVEVMIGNKHISFPQPAGADLMQIDSQYNRTIWVNPAKDVFFSGIQIRQQDGYDFTQHGSQSIEETSDGRRSFILPEVDGTYEVLLNLATYETGSPVEVQYGFTLVVGTGAMRVDNPILPSFLFNSNMTARISFPNHTIQFRMFGNPADFFWDMRLAPIEQAPAAVSLPVPKRFFITIESGEHRAIFDFTPSGIVYNGKSYYPQDMGVLEKMLKRDKEMEGYLHYNFEYLGKYLPFDANEVKIAHFSTGGAKGPRQDEDRSAKDAFEQVASVPIHVWKDSEQHRDSGNMGGFLQWTFTLKDGREYLCFLAGGESYLQAPDGTRLVTFYHPFTNSPDPALKEENN